MTAPLTYSTDLNFSWQQNEKQKLSDSLLKKELKYKKIPSIVKSLLPSFQVLFVSCYVWEYALPVCGCVCVCECAVVSNL